MKSTRFKTKTEKGITLIALIITIVVLMILAAVAINSITNEGILEQAGSTANKYNQAAKNEESYLQDYEDMLTAANGGYNDKNFKVGDKVIITVGSETHNFYVIEDKTLLGKVVLLAKENINTITLKQENANTTVFSETNYWHSEDIPADQYGDYEEYLDLTENGEPDSTHNAAYAAYQYGLTVGGAGRLMTYAEANALVSIDSAMIYGREATNGFLRYWLATAESFNYVLWVYGDNAGDFNFIDYDAESPCGVRPVIEISKSKVTLVTE